MTTPEWRRHLALHEAGHAVADVVLGRQIEYVSIRSGKTFGGVAVPVAHKPDTTGFDLWPAVVMQPPALRADVERQIISVLAGDIAAFELLPSEATPARYYSTHEGEAIARQALDNLPSRIAELVVQYEEDEEATGGDEARARELAWAISGPASNTLYLEWLKLEARQFVQRYKAAILRVADALERHAVLHGEQIAALVYPPKRST